MDKPEALFQKRARRWATRHNQASSHPLAARCQADAPPHLAIPVVDTERRFLIYAPQHGFSNQLLQLFTAFIYAGVLGRTLVVPHTLGHFSHSIMANYSSLFDLTRLEEPVLNNGSLVPL